MSADRKFQKVTKSDFTAVPLLDRIPPLSMLKPQPVNWTVKSLVPSESLVLMAGGPGNYKSWIALDMAVSVASGHPFADLGTGGPMPVLYIDRENGIADIDRRRGMQHSDHKSTGFCSMQSQVEGFRFGNIGDEDHIWVFAQSSPQTTGVVLDVNTDPAHGNNGLSLGNSALVVVV